MYCSEKKKNVLGRRNSRGSDCRDEGNNTQSQNIVPGTSTAWFKLNALYLVSPHKPSPFFSSRTPKSLHTTCFMSICQNVLLNGLSFFCVLSPEMWSFEILFRYVGLLALVHEKKKQTPHFFFQDPHRGVILKPGNQNVNLIISRGWLFGGAL